MARTGLGRDPGTTTTHLLFKRGRYVLRRLYALLDLRTRSAIDVGTASRTPKGIVQP